MILALVPAAIAEEITVRLDADQVDFSYDRSLVTLSGDARVFSQIVDDPSRFAQLYAEMIEGDLARGRFELLGEVRIVTAQGTLRGDAAFYDAQAAEFSLRRAGLMAPVATAAEQTVHGYAYAREISGEDRIVYLVDGRFTTCDRVHPHYAVVAKRLIWDQSTQQLIVEGGGIELYGLRVPFLPRLKHSFAPADEEGLDLTPIPRYTGREGLRLSWEFMLGEPGSDINGRAGLGLRQRKGLQTWVWGTTAQEGPLTARFGASLRENNDGDIDQIISLDRLPEVGIAGEWALSDGVNLSTDLSLGHYRQRAEDAVPEVEEQRGMLEAILRGRPASYYQPGASWWWVAGSHARYGDGAHYSRFGAGLGASTSLTPWLSGSAELRHHLTDGVSPFAWDDVDIRTELQARSEVRFGPAWRLRLGGRYDFDSDDLRWWNAELRRWEHCLTWKLGYSNQGDFVTLGVEINGLFGNDEPPPQGSLEDGPPDMWADAVDSEAAYGDVRE